MPRLRRLKELRPDFRCTLFAIPALCPPDWLASMPEWVELAMHGWTHDSVFECREWSKERMLRRMHEPIVEMYFVQGFCAPGWQISDGCYEALLEEGWWVADQHLEDARRPKKLKVYLYEEGHWHGHTHNVCGNGIEETWDALVAAVNSARRFEFASEAAY